MKLTMALSALVLCSLELYLPSVAFGQTEIILHSFRDGSVTNDGAQPEAALIKGKDGSLFGTTWYGGSTTGQPGNEFGSGTVFKIARSGAVTVIYSFADGHVANDGLNPNSSLVLGRDGNFYGTTSNGGSTCNKRVFQNGWGRSSRCDRLERSRSYTLLVTAASSMMVCDRTQH